MHMPVVSSLLAASAAARISGNVTQGAIFLPDAQPANAEKLDPQLVGFSIELDRWPDWAGRQVGRPNQFVHSVMRQLTDRSGAPPYFRIGGTIQDQSFLDLNLQVSNATYPASTPSNPSPAAIRNNIGRDFYVLSGNMPAGSSFHWGVNGRSFNDTESIEQFKLLADSFYGSGQARLQNPVYLKEIELGNQPDTWSQLINAPYFPHNYTMLFQRISSQVIDFFDTSLTGFSIGGNGHFNPAYNSLIWTASALFQADIFSDPKIKKNTPNLSNHAYCRIYDGFIPIPGQLMDKANIRGNLSTNANDIKATRAEGKKFIFSETNSYANHGANNASNTAESALWGIDWLLQGASMGIERFHFHNGPGYYYNTLQPIKLDGTGLSDDVPGRGDRPHINALYNGLLVVNEAIGNSGRSYVAEISGPNDKLTSYGIWEDGVLRRMVVINTQVYTPSTQGGRPGFDISLINWQGSRTATVKRLYTPYTTSKTGLTWAGQDFDRANGEPTRQVIEEPVNGTSFQLEASSAVLICFK